MSDFAWQDLQMDASAFEHIGAPGRRVAWRRWGSGAPLVLLHGGHGSWRHWWRNIEALSRHRMLLVPDLPGFGDSDAAESEDPHAPDRLTRLVDALTSSLDSLLGPRTAIALGGFSFGGLVAAHVAVKRGRVSRLALLGPAGHGSPRRVLEPMQNWRVDERAEMLAALRQNLRALMLRDADRIDDLAIALHEASCRLTRFRSREISMSGSLRQTLAAFTAPVLAVWGRHDVTATPEIAGPLLCDGFENRCWKLVDDAGHWVQYEQAEAVNTLLSNWVASSSEP